MALSDIFSVQVFFLVFRETLETAVIVSVLLSFLAKGFGKYESLSAANQKIYNVLFRQVWIGAATGLLICLLVGAVFIFVFYILGINLWNKTEKLWEAGFSMMASMMITYMGLAMLRINKLKAKWRRKLAQAIVVQSEQSSSGGNRFRMRFGRKYLMATLPMVTTLREGLEAIMFIGGLSASQPLSSVPLAVISALLLGSLVGFALYRNGTNMSLQLFLVISTCFLYLVAAGLCSRGVWFYEQHVFISRVGMDISETGSGPGSYDITRSVWHVNCCNPEKDGPWMVFNALLGWQNSATYGSVISYDLYWIFICLWILKLQYLERKGSKQNLTAEVTDYDDNPNEEASLLERASNVLSLQADQDSASSTGRHASVSLI